MNCCERGVVMVYVTSDSHFNHINILKYEPNRKKHLGETIEAHDEELIARYNSKVKPNDLVYFLGDIGFGSIPYLKSVISKLNGNKILILGNHDKHSKNAYLSMGFLVVCHGMEIKVGKTRLVLSHYPYRKPWWKVIFPWQYKERDRHKRPFNNGRWLMHGHVHSGGSYKIKKVINKQIHIGVDANNYYPVSLDEISTIIDRS